MAMFRIAPTGFVRAYELLGALLESRRTGLGEPLCTLLRHARLNRIKTFAPLSAALGREVPCFGEADIDERPKSHVS
jgi:hypothetical protein